MARERGRRGRSPVTSAPETISDAKVDIVLQRIEEKLGDELNVIPQHVRRYGVNNIFQRTFAYLLGWKSDGVPTKLAATMTGALKIASVGAGLEKMESKTGIATDTLSGAKVFSQLVSRLDIYVKEYDMWLYTSPDGVTFYGPIRCLKDIRNIFDISTHSFKVQRAEINDVEYEVVGEW